MSQFNKATAENKEGEDNYGITLSLNDLIAVTNSLEVTTKSQIATMKCIREGAFDRLRERYEILDSWKGEDLEENERADDDDYPMDDAVDYNYSNKPTDEDNFFDGKKEKSEREFDSAENNNIKKTRGMRSKV